MKRLRVARACYPPPTAYVMGVGRSQHRTLDRLRTEGEQAIRSNPNANTIDEYLAALSDDRRAALEGVRKTIRATAPGAEECISYRLPAFRLDGKLLVAFGATAKHCAFYPMSGTTVEAHEDELEDYDTSKGTVRFRADDPLPAALVRKLVKARIAENAEQ